MIRLDLAGSPAVGNSSTNDLDMVLMDKDGRMLERSSRGVNGQPEFMSTRLPAGTYIVVVRSYYLKPETKNFVFKSGDYRLTVQFNNPPDTIAGK